MGLVLDAGIEEQLRIRHLQVADATRASLGLPVLEYIVTDTPLEVRNVQYPFEYESSFHGYILSLRTCRWKSG